MDQINKIIGKNLKRFRIEKGYTLDQVAELTNVSKSMIGQIERGESTPTVTTLWKISNGLKISFSSLMEDESEESFVIKKEDVDSLSADEGYKVYTYIPFNINRKFEAFMIELKPQIKHESPAHTEALFEYVFVLSGEIEITAKQIATIIKKDEMLRFKANTSHSYFNLSSNQDAKAIVVIVYP
ncbi:XRE family transcriptional regulator [Siminovitchia sp. FSL H7-0308]|uniref:Transcriptional regulator with XRE-family HTH domain n=1 Tax=Siminovitchia thermophila TaxID=1245522 RepID=A0ABS2R8C1_9BACI|nr:XRE family transcriptional regulator [Siminovitchia thermophila]MBM7715389.1 transcriptional regulator with XRE-family HTH domain [Siminovitchia thermophila]ONK22568.1 hypothetical protein BLX87_15430 [Bacillus sp. VT-16-64]